MLYFALSSVVVTFALCYILYVAVGLRRLRTRSIAALLDSISYVDLVKIGLVARALPVDHGGVSLSTEELIALLGGYEGLRKLLHNASVVLQLSRYLTLIKPEASALAQQIRHDAVRIRRVTLLLLIRQKLHVGCLGSPLTVRGLARVYFALSVYTSELCVHLSDDLMLILEGWKGCNARIARVGGDMVTTAAR